MKNIIDFTALEIRIASPEVIKSWSFGEVRKPETINYRSLRAEKDGLFDEKIFGPMKDYECYCGKYKRIRYRGIICDKCGVEVTQSKVRRERMGHISLAAPVSHIWFFKGAPSKLSLLLDISPRNINALVYFSKYIVLEVDVEEKARNLEKMDLDLVAAIDSLKAIAKVEMEKISETLKQSLVSLKAKVTNKETLQLKVSELELKAKNKIASLKKQLDSQTIQTEEIYKALKSMVKKINLGIILSEDEYLKLEEYEVASHLRVGMGAESLLELVQDLQLDNLVEKLRLEMNESKGARRIKATKRLRVIEGMQKAQIDPTWMFLSVLPVIPPDLRPMVQLSGGRFATSDLNDLYRRVINRNNRLKHLIDLGAPEIILRNEKRMLQEAVDSLIDGTQARQSRRRATRRPLKSLSEMLRGKQGRFRQNLLGKRVDYSGRSVIVVGPELKLNECGIPKDMALEIFKPYVLRELIVQGVAPNVKSARQLIERREPMVYDILEQVTTNHPVILNRAPTLHKLGMQSFFPILIEGNAIRLHPCVCSGYNADFDGDQMAVHVPLTVEAQAEASGQMMATHNLLKPANGEPITVPNKEMAMGIYYLTIVNEDRPVFPRVFANKAEALFAYQVGVITRRQLITVRLHAMGASEQVKTTVGRLLFNAVLPDSFEFINEPVNAQRIKQIVTRAIQVHKQDEVSALIDNIKDLGFRAATDSGLSVSVTDCAMIPEKNGIIDLANKQVETIQEEYLEGSISADERKRLAFDVWIQTTDTVAQKTWDSYSENNAVKVMINSGGTRASKDQVKQLAAMRGLVVDPLGNIVEMPTKSNFREGLSIFEYVTSARGSRKGLTDSAIKTADAGYLTRRLCDVAHDVIIRLEDCGATEGIEIVQEDRPDIYATRIMGRIAVQDIKDGKKTLVKQGEIILPALAQEIAKAKISTVFVRSPLACQAIKGMCSQCYGWDFSTHDIVQIGVPVGIIAAQSIGEPGTQLTMRVKHSGGIIGLDVTQGLPRVEELLEARTPKNQALITEVAGKVKIKTKDDETIISIGSIDKVEYTISSRTPLIVSDGDVVHIGQQLTGGSINLRELLQLQGLLSVQQHLVREVQRVYESQGIPIHDKHFEVIVRKMSDKLQIEASGDTSFLAGEIAQRSRFSQINEETIAAGGEPATAKVLFLGITRSSLYTDSWLSAASFQHTKHILTDAASIGAVDELQGLKENVIIGRLIPTSEERARIEGV
ncbi:MAG: DNA-directed RNA polymerase subunit beta' [Candidatus Pacebacteria bacterium RIFCSPHIGHO2_01_FULL_46_16]|nr:MAG: DNA-directed RNA polymerase subunit beta' [Candidatus Pacebacteria bacterium RIFCSPHIGHO2_01_FULL_46_16]